MWAIYSVCLVMAVYFLFWSGFFGGVLVLILGVGLVKYLKSLEERLIQLELELKKRPLSSGETTRSFQEPTSTNCSFDPESVRVNHQDEDAQAQDAYKEILNETAKLSQQSQKSDVSQAINPENLPYTSTWGSQAPQLNEAHKPSDIDHERQVFESAQRVITWIKTTLFAMNPIATIGVIILFIGVAFLLKYASNYIHFSIEMRLFAVAVAGVIGLILGWRLHQSKPVFANILEGCSVGLLYLITYTAFKVYGLLPPFPAFIILLSIVLCSSIISVIQNAKSLAILGVLGGFFSPILISTGEGNFVLLFSYYTVLNLGILGLAWFKSWSELNLVGFMFTFIVSSLWGWQSYKLEYFYITEFFLLLFFLFYVVIAILYAANKAKQNRYYIDTIITIGTPFITLFLQTGLVRRWPYGLAWSSLAFGVFYAVVALIIYRLRYPALKRLMEVFAALALIFATAAIPLASTGNWAVIAWAFEGLVLMYLGIKDNQMRLRLSACALEVGSGVLFLIHYGFIQYIDVFTIRPWFDILYVTAGIIGLSGIICSCMWFSYEKKCAPFELTLMQLLFIWGLLWWYVNGIEDIKQHIRTDHAMMGYTLFFAVSSIIFWPLSELFRWSALRYAALALLPMMFLFELSSLMNNLAYDPVLVGAWIISFIILYGMLYYHEKIPAPYLPFIHIVSLLLLTCVITDQISRAIDFYSNWPNTWQYIIWGMVPSLLLFLINQEKVPYLNRYAYAWGGILSVFVMAWTLISYFLSGDMYPLPYIPVLNPLELVEGFALFSAISWFLNNSDKLSESLDLTKKATFILFSCFIFLFLNTIILRTLHHWLNIPYTAVALWHDSSVQTALSIFWMLLALTTTFIAARNHSRILWFSGFILIGIVIVKLFFIDLSNISSLERILTFITVGILMLINGYISPMPPKEEDSQVNEG